MMAAQQRDSGLVDRLPNVRGRYQSKAVLSKLTWLQVGGPAEVLYRPADLIDLQNFLAALTDDVPLTVIGVGSNLLVRDGGIPGVVVRLGDGFTNVSVNGEYVTAGAGASNLRLAKAARDASIGGLEFLSGIPGSLGGSLRMNAGAFDREISDVFQVAIGLAIDGSIREFNPTDMGFGYRYTGIEEEIIFVRATLRGSCDSCDAVADRMAAIQSERANRQPTRTPTGGSTFINPPGARAWELIDAAGCRGLRRGRAVVSEKHCNFLINEGNATAADLEGLGEEVRRRVFETSGVELQWEIRRIGETLGPLAREVMA